MNANAAGEGRPFLPEPCTWRTYGDMNVVLWRKQQETPLEEARGPLEESHNVVMALAEGFSDEELFHKGRFDWTGRTTLGSYLRERHELPLRLGAQKTARPQEELRTARWSEMRLSLGRIRGLSGCVVQNASESARIRPDPAQIAKLRRILDRPTRKMLHPVVEAALPPPWFGGAPGARFGGVFRARARSHRGRQPPI